MRLLIIDNVAVVGVDVVEVAVAGVEVHGHDADDAGFLQTCFCSTHFVCIWPCSHDFLTIASVGSI